MILETNQDGKGIAAPMIRDPEQLEQQIEALRVENVALEEQVKLLVRTEHRLSMYQNTVQSQLSRIEGAVALVSTLSMQESEVAALARVTKFLRDHFLVHAVATFGIDTETNRVRLVTDASRDVAMEASGGPREVDFPELMEMFSNAKSAVVWEGQASSAFWPPECGYGRYVEPIRDCITSLVKKNQANLSDDDGYVLVPIQPNVGRVHWYILLASLTKGRSSHYVARPRQEDVPFFSLLGRHLNRFFNDKRQADDLKNERAKLAESNQALHRSLRELRATQQRLVRSTKLEAVGRLSAGVAHDFNNLLTLILGYGTELREEFAEGSRQQEDMDSILDAGQRAASLTKQLLVFGRGKRLRSSRVDLNEVVSGVLNMLRRMLSEDIEFRCELSEGELPIVADPVELEQVVMNLIINAQDAMPRGGALKISTRMCIDQLTPDASGAIKSSTPKACAVLTVSDTGHGIDEETRDRIFEPFFTTKDVGKGTGMGLAIVYGVVSESGGEIDVQSTVGKGTQFTVKLPLSEDVSGRLIHDQATQKARPNRGTVAILEDEPGILALCDRILSSRGFRVVTCASAEEAFAAITHVHMPADMLLLDVVMPNICGPDVAKAARQMRPDVPILFMSGHTRSKLDAHEFDADRDQLLRKPFSPDALLAAVEQALRLESAQTS